MYGHVLICYYPGETEENLLKLRVAVSGQILYLVKGKAIPLQAWTDP
jgi:hypothetical protein